MEEFMYSALDIAAIISSMDLGCKDESRIIDLIWNNERYFLVNKYHNNKRKFILDVHYWMHYFYEKPILDSEFPSIKKDFLGKYNINKNEYIIDYSNLDLFFKSLRIRILYGTGKNYIRIKLRVLIMEYGYKRRSIQLINHIKKCMEFYNLEATLRGGEYCDIATCDLDKMLTFRIIENKSVKII